MKKFHTFKHQSFELLTGLRSFFAVTLMLVMALGNIKAEEITVVFQDYGYSDGQEVWGDSIGTQGYFSFTTAQNDATTAVKYYDSGASLRMYVDRNGGNGCSFTVNVLNSNYVITGMQVISQGTSYLPPVAYSVNGGAEVAATLNGLIYTISDVYATQSLMFKNVRTGSTTPQLRITSIVITYKQICNTPTDFVVSNIGNINADLSWTKGGAETNWQMNLNGTISDLTGCTTNVDTVSYGLSGLNINQEYHIAVRSACDVDNFSLWTDTIDFTTTCPEYITNLPDLTICSNESYDFFGTAITAEGNYTHTLQSTTGCDSIINLHVLVNQVPVAVLPSESICEGSFFNFGGENLTLAGTYRDTLIGAAATGCDSIVEITLIVNPKAVKNITATICDGDSYFFDGNALTAAGDYTETLAGAAANGCDSVTNLTLFVQPIPVNNISVTICDNESYEFGGEMLTIAGNYADTILHNGCDSIVNLTLTVNPTYATADAVAICADELPYTYGDTVFQAGTVSDVYVIHSSSELGCDSVITLTLNVKQLYVTDDARTICDSELPYTYGGHTFEVGTVSGNYDIHFTSALGCDSTVNLDLTVNPTYVHSDMISVCDVDLPITYEGTEFPVGTVTGTYPIHLTSINGCDSLINLTLNVNPTYSHEDYLTICNDQLPYNYNGSWFNVGTISGDYTIHYTLPTTCDSLVTLHLTVNDTAHTYDAVTICDSELPYNYNDVRTFDETTTSGIYNISLSTANGCDSLVTLTFTVNPSYIVTADPIVVCDNELPVYVGDSSFYTAGDKQVHFTLETGCDSLVNVNITINPTAHTFDDLTICDNQLPYNYNHQEIFPVGTTTGVYDVEGFHTQAGCDSLVTLNLTVNPTYHTYDVVTICNNILPYNYRGHSLDAAGTYDIPLQTQNGCDSIVTLTLIVNPVYSFTDEVTICDAELPYTYSAGHTFDAAGIYPITYTTQEGCDSLVTLTLNVNSTYHTDDVVTICDVELPYQYGDSIFNAAGNYDVHFTLSTLCDSLVSLTLNVNPTFVGTDTVDICINELPYSYPNSEYLFPEGTVTGVYPLHLQTVSGCDSLIQLTLNVNPIYNHTDELTICASQLPFHYGDATFTAAGIYDVHFTLPTGCDSLVTVTLHVNPDYVIPVSGEICAGDTYTIHAGTSFERNLTTSGVYIDTLPTIDGCDSVVVLTLTVYELPNVQIVSEDNVCSGESITLTATGVAMYDAALTEDFNTMTGSNGNEYGAGVAIPNYTLASFPTTTRVYPAGGAIRLGTTNRTGTMISQQMDLSEPFTVIMGVKGWLNNDGIIRATVGSQIKNITAPQFATWANGGFTEIATNFNAATDHSTITFATLAGNSAAYIDYIYVIPTNALPYSWNTGAVTSQITVSPLTETQYTVVGTDEHGCVNTASQTITVNPTYTTNVDVVVCDDEVPYYHNGRLAGSVTGTYPLTYLLTTGCDSLVTVNLTVNPTYHHTDNVTICDSDLDYHYGDSIFTAAGVYDVHFSTINGCDSVVTLTLNVNPTYTGTDVVTICDNELPYTYQVGHEFDAAGEYDVLLSTVNGCDSLIHLTLNVNPTYTHTDAATICSAELPYTYGTREFPIGTTTGVYPVHFTLGTGCDSLINLSLTVNQTYEQSEIVAVCENQLPYTFGTQSLNAAGNYDETFTSVNNCDSLVHLTLIVNPIYTGNDVVTICANELPYTYSDGYTYTSEGTYQVMLQSVNGCDSLINLTLNVNPTYTHTDAVTICSNELPYTYGDSIFPVGTVTGVYPVHFTLIPTGCDSLINLSLIVNDITACSFVVNATAGANGTITPVGEQTIAHGSDATFTITPNACYYIAGVLVDGADITITDPTSMTYTFDSVYTNHSIAATFAVNQYNMTSTNNGNGTVSSAIVNCGDDYTFDITANTGYHIDSLYLDGVLVQNFGDENTVDYDYTILNVTAAHELQAYFSINHFTVNSTFDGFGTISFVGDSVVAFGDQITYTFIATHCNELADVTVNGVSMIGDVVGNTFTIEDIAENTSIIFTFDTIQYAMNADLLGNGHGTVTTGFAPCGQSYIFDIVADEGSHISSIRLGTGNTTFGDESVVDYPITITNASRDTTIHVTFTLNKVNITASVVGVGGTVTPTAAIVDYGTSQTFTVTADAVNGYSIETITCGDSVLTFTDNTFTYDYEVVNITSDTSVEITFALNEYLVDVTIEGNGTVTPDDTVIIYNDDVTFTINAAPCHFISALTVDGVPATITDIHSMTYTFTDVQSAHAINAVFTIHTYDMTSTAGANGTIDNALLVNCGSDFTYTITADEGYHVDTVWVDGVATEITGQQATYQVPFTNITANHNVIANFAINEYIVTASTDANGTITPVGDSVVEHGADVQYTFAANACYHLADVIVNGTSVIDDIVANTYTIQDITAPATIAASYAINQYNMTSTILAGNGTVTPDTIANCGDHYDYHFTAGTGYHVATISVGGNTVFNGTNDDAAAVYTINTVSQDTNVQVTFAINTYTVTTVATTGQGTFSPATQTVNYGDDLTITVDADNANGYHINSITCGNDVVGYGNNTDITANYTIMNIISDTTLYAEFSLDGHFITVVVNGEGQVVPLSTSLTHGDDITFNITPNDCHYIGEILVDGVDAMADITGDSTSATYTFDSVVVPHTIEVTFDIYQYEMTSQAFGHGTASSAVVNCGDDYNYEVIADEGYHIHTIFVDYVSDTLFENQEATYTYPMTDIRANHNLIADFEINQYTVTAIAGLNGAITPMGDSVVNHGDAMNFVITPDPCYYLADLTVNGVSVLPDVVANNYLLSDIAVNTTVEATFAIYEYVMNADITGLGTVTTDTVNCGDSYTYNIAAGEGYHIETITIGGNTTTYGNNNDVTETVTVTTASQDTTLTVVFGINTYTITTTVTSGQGEFVPATATVNHGSDYTFTINADVANGYHVQSVTCGNDVVLYGNNTDASVTYTIINIVSDTAISAIFELNNYVITASNGMNGMIDPIGDSAVIYGDNVTYTITPDACYYISEILIDGAAVVIDDTTGTTYTFNAIDASHTIVANFAIYEYNMASVANGNGTVSSAVVNCGTDYTYNIAADYGYHIDSVYVDGALDSVFNNQENTYTYSFTNITAHHNLTAYFSINHYTMTATAGANGTINPIGDSIATHGQDLVYTITPDHCYYIDEVLVDGVSAMNDLIGDVNGATYTFNNIQGPHTIDVTFAIYQYAMNANVTGNGTVSTATINCGTDYTYNVQAGTGYHIATIQIGDTIATFGNNTDVTTTFDIINALQDTTLNVVFAINTYNVTTLVQSGQGEFVPASAIVNHGDNYTFTINADDANGYHIVDVTCGTDVVVYGNNADITTTYTVTNIISDTMVKANFALNVYNIVATEGANGHITPLGASNVTHGDNITYTITPDAPCYYISQILVDGAAIAIDDTTGTTYTFTNVVDHHAIDVAFQIYEYNMTSTAIGNGTVSSAVVNCGTDYTYQIDANYGYHIDSVLVDGALESVFNNQEATYTYQFTNILTHHNVVAYFSINHYGVTAIDGANGSITPAGVTVVAHGDNLTYTITPNACYYIDEVLVDGVPVTVTDITGMTYTFTNIIEPHTIAPTFAIYQYDMTYTATLGGTVSPVANPTVVNCGTDYVYTVTADLGYHIESITLYGNTTIYGNNEDVTATVNVNDVAVNTNLDVVFAINTYNIDVTTIGHGTTTPGDTTVDYGTTLTYTVNADHGYHIVSVLVDGVSAGTFGNRDDSTFTYTFANIDNHHTLVAEFAINSYEITATAGANGTIMMPGVTTVTFNEDVNYTITANIGYHINTITIDGVIDTTFINNENLYIYTFENVDADHTIHAEFAVNTYDVNITTTGNGTATPGDTTLNYGDDLTYTFTPNVGSEVVSVIVNGVDLGAFGSYTITDIAQDYDIEVVFGDITHRLQAVAYGEGTITPVDTTVAHFGNVVYTLTPNDACYEISEILVDGQSYLINAAFDAVANTLTIDSITDDMLIQAYYQIKHYTVTSATTVGATITETGVYDCGTDVVYTITVDDCYNMDSVVVDGVTVANTTTITFNDIDFDHSIEAFFSIKTYEITATVNNINYGEIMVNGNPVNTIDTFDCGSTPIYTIEPALGYHIDSVFVDGAYVGAISTYTFAALNANHTIHAVFAINTYTITSTANTGVTIAPIEGDTVVDYGTDLTYIFTVDNCYDIIDVLVDGVSVGNPTTYTFNDIDADHTISVIAQEKTYQITASVQGVGGTIAPAGVTDVACQGSQNYVVTPAVGYYIESVLVDGVDQGAINSYFFNNVTANHTIEVIFASYDSLTYTITSTADVNGTISPLGNVTVYQGQSQAYVITPDPMYEILDVLVDNVSVGNVSYYNFVNVTANHTIHATFTAATCPTPTNPYESNITDSSATLNWGDVETNSYTVRYKKATDAAFTIISGITANSYVLTGLDEATTYVWSVKSVCIDSIAESNWTSQRTFVTVDAIDTTGISTSTIETINVYSYGNNIYVQNNSQEQIKAVQVFDMFGRMVYTGKAQNNPEIINIQAATGNYIVRVIGSRQVGSYKVHISQR